MWYDNLQILILSELIPLKVGLVQMTFTFPKSLGFPGRSATAMYVVQKSKTTSSYFCLRWVSSTNEKGFIVMEYRSFYQTFLTLHSWISSAVVMICEAGCRAGVLLLQGSLLTSLPTLKPTCWFQGVVRWLPLLIQEGWIGLVKILLVPWLSCCLCNL